MSHSTSSHLLADLGIERVAAGAFEVYQNGLIEHFNTLLVQFIKDLKIAFSGRVDLQTQTHLISSLTTRDKCFFIKQFYECAIAKLTCQDELSDDMRDDFILHKIRAIPIFRSLQLHVHWSDIPEESKINIWKYIQALWKCSVNYHDESKDTMIERAMDVVHTPQFHDTMLSLIANLGNNGDDKIVSEGVNIPKIQSFITDMLGHIKSTSDQAEHKD